MGVILCPTHGRKHITPCCVHVADAVDRGVLEHAHVVLDDWGTPSIVCSPCMQLIHAEVRSTSEPRVGVDDALESPNLPYCEECLRDWYSATNQGHLVDVIKCVRRKYTASRPHILPSAEQD